MAGLPGWLKGVGVMVVTGIRLGNVMASVKVKVGILPGFLAFEPMFAWKLEW
jgi:hypothetical protein